MKKMVLWTGKAGRKSINWCEAYVYGIIGCIGIFEIGHLIGVFFHKTVTFCGDLILGLLAAAFLLLLGFVWMGRRKNSVEKKGISKRRVSVAAIFFTGLLGVQIYHICTAVPMWIPGDITLETVNSFLATDGIYVASPLTGRGLGEMPLRYKILCLPTLYTLLCKWFAMEPELLVCRVIPVLTVFGTYGAYYVLSGALFGKERDCNEKRLWFLSMVAAVIIFCEQSVYMDGYGLLHAGYVGTTWRNCVLVPFVISAALERKWGRAVLCILAEACIVWTLWGFGVCAMITAGIGSLGFVRDVLKKSGWISALEKKEGNHR